MKARFTSVAAVAATLAMGFAGVASASAAQFKSSGAGSLSAKALETQVFTTSAGKVECNALTATGSIPAGEKETQAAVVKYEECTAFGEPAEISPAHYTFNADGNVTITEPITIKVNVFGSEVCKVTVEDQTVGTVGYENLSNGNIKLVPNVTGIASSGSGSLCEYNETGSAAKGTYTGASEVHNSGGTIEVV